MSGFQYAFSLSKSAVQQARPPGTVELYGTVSLRIWSCLQFRMKTHSHSSRARGGTNFRISPRPPTTRVANAVKLPVRSIELETLA